jgi:hypothetical protein
MNGNGTFAFNTTVYAGRGRAANARTATAAKPVNTFFISPS